MVSVHANKRMKAVVLSLDPPAAQPWQQWWTIPSEDPRWGVTPRGGQEEQGTIKDQLITFSDLWKSLAVTYSGSACVVKSTANLIFTKESAVEVFSLLIFCKS